VYNARAEITLFPCSNLTLTGQRTSSHCRLILRSPIELEEKVTGRVVAIVASSRKVASGIGIYRAALTSYNLGRHADAMLSL
jgi:hypothetical protein